MSRATKPKVSSISSRLLNRFVLAAMDYERKGSYHPDDWEAIEAEYNAALTMLKCRIEKLEAIQTSHTFKEPVFRG